MFMFYVESLDSKIKMVALNVRANAALLPFVKWDLCLGFAKYRWLFPRNNNTAKPVLRNTLQPVFLLNLRIQHFISTYRPNLNNFAMDSGRSRKPVDWFCKLLILGDAGVGKTSIVERFTKNEFTTSFVATIGEYGFCASWLTRAAGQCSVLDRSWLTGRAINKICLLYTSPSPRDA